MLFFYIFLLSAAIYKARSHSKYTKFIKPLLLNLMTIMAALGNGLIIIGLAILAGTFYLGYESYTGITSLQLITSLHKPKQSQHRNTKRTKRNE